MKVLSKKNIEEILLDRAFFEKIDSQNVEINNQNEFGKFSLTSEEIGNSRLLKWKSSFVGDTKVLGEMATPSLRIYFLNRSLQGINTGLGKTLHGNNFQGSTNVLFCNGDCSGFTSFGKDDLSEITTIAISAERFSFLAQQYPELFEKIHKRYQTEKNFLLHQHSPFISLEMNTLLQQIENSHLMGNAACAYADAKTLELLVLQMNLLGQKEKSRYCKTQSDINKLHEVCQILTSDLSVSFSLSDISKKVGLNENKLKYGFKEVFGTTVFGYLFDYKMELARKYLLDTDKSISEIASLCGYDYVSHFSTAFKRKWGVSPQQIRK